MKKFLNFTYKKLPYSNYESTSIFNKFRTIHKNSVLFEINDPKKNKHLSYICFDPIASIKIEQNILTRSFDGKKEEHIQLEKKANVISYMQDFISHFDIEKHNFDFINNGLFGYMSYDTVRFFEKIDLPKSELLSDIPDLQYFIYRNLIVLDHINKEIYLTQYYAHDEEPNLDLIETIFCYRTVGKNKFKRLGEITSNIEDNKFKSMVSKAKEHCLRGDVFQLVLSKRFKQSFEGDEFNVFKTLKEINSSPYMFFYNYENFKLFGCSPEAQLVVNDNIAEIHPIAGTYKRSGDDCKDKELANELFANEKENSEHVMLVDLARNDLSRNAMNVKVETYKEIQFFSHVIHMVSKVVGKINKNVNTIQLVADTFPAGTLSGAPKYKAMELIEKYEPTNRNFYGGAIGYFDFEGNYEHAIMIRSFLSKNSDLSWQAGAGIVIGSCEENELKEVYNKSAALVRALECANQN